MLYNIGGFDCGDLPMPVTARLSRKFYDRFGDDIANDLVDWFNQVDATYRADLRQLNELNFARFDAKLEQRTSQLESKLEQRIAQVESKLEQRIAQVESKLEQRIGELGQHITQVDAKLEQRTSQLESKLDAKMAALRAELIKWMFVFWAGTVIPIVGMVALLTR
jgi:septal ring factor EnvC (AmiA/AmiB activator)